MSHNLRFRESDFWYGVRAAVYLIFVGHCVCMCEYMKNIYVCVMCTCVSLVWYMSWTKGEQVWVDTRVMSALCLTTLSVYLVCIMTSHPDI